MVILKIIVLQIVLMNEGGVFGGPPAYCSFVSSQLRQMLQICRDSCNPPCELNEDCVTRVSLCLQSPCPNENICVNRQMCSQPMDPGPCSTIASRRWYFNSTVKSCQTFIYGGCFGNMNNFITVDECRRACEPPEAMAAPLASSNSNGQCGPEPVFTMGINTDLLRSQPWVTLCRDDRDCKQWERCCTNNDTKISTCRRIVTDTGMLTCSTKCGPGQRCVAGKWVCKNCSEGAVGCEPCARESACISEVPQPRCPRMELTTEAFAPCESAPLAVSGLFCRSDTDCSVANNSNTSSLCCNIGCGVSSCMPAYTPLSKNGTCSAAMLKRPCAGIEYEIRCRSDFDCPNEQVCCQTSCNVQICSAPATAAPSTPACSPSCSNGTVCQPMSAACPLCTVEPCPPCPIGYACVNASTIRCPTAQVKWTEPQCTQLASAINVASKAAFQSNGTTGTNFSAGSIQIRAKKKASGTTPGYDFITPWSNSGQWMVSCETSLDCPSNTSCCSGPCGMSFCFAPMNESISSNESINGNNINTWNVSMCSLPAETGNCRAAFPRFAYNSTSKMCYQFMYGGCGGNGNNFNAIGDCLAKCNISQSNTQNSTMEPRLTNSAPAPTTNAPTATMPAFVNSTPAATLTLSSTTIAPTPMSTAPPNTTVAPASPTTSGQLQATTITATTIIPANATMAPNNANTVTNSPTPSSVNTTSAAVVSTTPIPLLSNVSASTATTPPPPSTTVSTAILPNSMLSTTATASTTNSTIAQQPINSTLSPITSTATATAIPSNSTAGTTILTSQMTTTTPILNINATTIAIPNNTFTTSPMNTTIAAVSTMPTPPTVTITMATTNVTSAPNTTAAIPTVVTTTVNVTNASEASSTVTPNAVNGRDYVAPSVSSNVSCPPVSTAIDCASSDMTMNSQCQSTCDCSIHGIEMLCCDIGCGTMKCLPGIVKRDGSCPIKVDMMQVESEPSGSTCKIDNDCTIPTHKCCPQASNKMMCTPAVAIDIGQSDLNLELAHIVNGFG